MTPKIECTIPDQIDRYRIKESRSPRKFRLKSNPDPFKYLPSSSK